MLLKTPGSVVHCVYRFFSPRDPGQNPGQKVVRQVDRRKNSKNLKKIVKTLRKTVKNIRKTVKALKTILNCFQRVWGVKGVALLIVF